MQSCLAPNQTGGMIVFCVLKQCDQVIGKAQNGFWRPEEKGKKASEAYSETKKLDI